MNGANIYLCYMLARAHIYLCYMHVLRGSSIFFWGEKVNNLHKL